MKSLATSIVRKNYLNAVLQLIKGIYLAFG